MERLSRWGTALMLPDTESARNPGLRHVAKHVEAIGHTDHPE